MSKNTSVQFIEECYFLYEQKMYRVALAILKDEVAAEDAVQEAFLKLMKSKTIFKDAKSDDCKRYIISVIKSAAISIYRVRKRDFKLIPLCDCETVLESKPETEDFDDAIDIRDILDELPPKYKDVVKCLAVDSMSVRETALKLNITESSVRKRFERAKKRIKTGNLQKDA